MQYTDSDNPDNNTYPGETVYQGPPSGTPSAPPQNQFQSQDQEPSQPQTEQNMDQMDEENLIAWYMKIGYALMLGFIFPIYFSSPFGSKLLFPNISGLGKGGFFMDFSLLYPLIAGGLILLIVKKLDDIKRGLAVLGVGLLPILIMHALQKDIVSTLVQGSMEASLVPQLVVLSIIGMYVGAKGTIKFDNESARLIGGISSISLLILILLPIGSKYGMFLSLFKSLSIKGMPGLVKVINVMVIGSFLVLIFAALLGMINFKRDRRTLEYAEKIRKMIFISILILIGIMVLMIFSSPGNSPATLIIKVFFYFAGIIGLFALSIWDIYDKSQPRTMKGGAIWDS